MMHVGETTSIVMPKPIDKVFVRGPNRVFVFGSNEGGQHHGGAARYAHDMLGAVWGVGEGHTGETYAIPTLDAKLRQRSLDEIQASVREFIAYALSRPELTFFVTRIGCGIAGFTDEQIAPMFFGVGELARMVGREPNIELPEGW